MIKYKTAYHTGGLKEMLENEKPIDNKTAEILINTRIYQIYGFDERINAERYIINDMVKNPGLPTWINKYNDNNCQPSLSVGTYKSR